MQSSYSDVLYVITTLFRNDQICNPVANSYVHETDYFRQIFTLLCNFGVFAEP